MPRRTRLLATGAKDLRGSEEEGRVATRSRCTPDVYTRAHCSVRQSAGFAYRFVLRASGISMRRALVASRINVRCFGSNRCFSVHIVPDVCRSLVIIRLAWSPGEMSCRRCRGIARVACVGDCCDESLFQQELGGDRWLEC